MPRVDFLGVVAVCFAAATLSAEDTAVIVDSGSTNTAGFQIAVDRSGHASYTGTPRRYDRPSDAQATVKSAKIASKLVKHFYADLEAAKPLSALPRKGCMKSASFGTTRTIQFAGEVTPDLGCGDQGNARMKALIADINEILKTFN